MLRFSWSSPRWNRLFLVALALGSVCLACGLTAAEDDPVQALQDYYNRHKEVRYGWGSCSETRMDCSCFIQGLFAELFDLRLSRDTLRQAQELRFLRVKELVRSDQLRDETLCPGDLIYTYSGLSWEKGPRHVTVYAGSGRILHSASRFQGVDLSAVSWLRKFRLEGVYRPLGC